MSTSSKQVRCGSRKKEQTCIASETCEWDGTRCHTRTGARTPSPEKKAPAAKKVRCAQRKEITCRAVPDMCRWDGTRCVSAPATQVVDAIVPTRVHVNVPAPDQSETAPQGSATDARHCRYYGDNTQLTATVDVNLKRGPRIAYDPAWRDGGTHLGQRKLALSELQLLTYYYRTLYPSTQTPPTVLYVGAAPGTHLVTLADMFPDVRFVLYDASPFNAKLHARPEQFELHEGADGFVSSDVIRGIRRRMSKYYVLFICDIRLGGEGETFEAGVERDMQMQREWMEILQPDVSLLKFRVPYTLKHGDVYKYNAGTLLYGVWAPPTSGETRLLVQRKDIGKTHTYDFRTYEETLAFHNRFRRLYCFSEELAKYVAHIDQTKTPYCGCYDCVSELGALTAYAETTGVPVREAIRRFNTGLHYLRMPAAQDMQALSNAVRAVQPTQRVVARRTR